MSLSSDAQRKLARIVEIQGTMTALERELEQLLESPGPRPLTALDRQRSPRKELPARLPNANKNRYSRGDQDRNDAVLRLLKEGRKARDIAAEVGCSVQTVHNLKSKFKKMGLFRGGDPTAPQFPTEDALTEEQFNDVRDEKNRGIDADRIAEDMNLPISEVRRAFRTPDYKGYMILRKAA